MQRLATKLFENNNNSSTNYFPHNVNAFMDELARRFTEVGSATIVGLMMAKKHAEEHGFNPSNEFGTEGFHHNFIDRQEGSDNQARHAVFGLILGYSGIPDPLGRANGREDASTASGAADIAMNNLTVPMGQRIMGGDPGHSGELSARGLADWIRQTLCAPR